MVDGKMWDMLLVVVETFAKKQVLLREKVVVDLCLPILELEQSSPTFAGHNGECSDEQTMGCLLPAGDSIFSSSSSSLQSDDDRV
eukprot:4074024-Prorocentrum_lima.AAC.1